MAAPRSALWALASVGAILFLGRRATASTQAPRVDSTWSLGRLTEYHPDAPASAGTAVLRREGGPRDRRRQPLITLEQHRSDRARYPYASVASGMFAHRSIGVLARSQQELRDFPHLGLHFGLVVFKQHFRSGWFPSGSP